MSKRDELLALAERCEAATGENFTIERDIWVALELWAIRPIPVYTTSLDAAMTLVGEGCGHALWGVLGKRPSAAIQFSCVDGRIDLTADGWTDWSGAATPALALCAAALRARAAMT